MNHIIAFMMILLCSAFVRAEPVTVQDERLQFTVRLPDGFVAAPPELQTAGFPYCYVRDQDKPERTMFIRLRGTGKRISPQEMTESERRGILQAISNAELLTERWKGLEIDGIRQVSTDTQGEKWVQYAVCIPLKTEAVLLLVSGHQDYGPEVRALVWSTLETFEGPPGWPTPGTFVLRRKHLVLAALMTAMIFCFVVWKWMRRGKTSSAQPLRG